MVRVRHELHRRGVRHVYVVISGQVNGYLGDAGGERGWLSEEDARAMFGFTEEDANDQRIGLFSLKVGFDYPRANAPEATLTETLMSLKEVLKATQPVLVVLPLLGRRTGAFKKDASHRTRVRSNTSQQQKDVEEAAVRGAQLAAEFAGITVMWASNEKGGPTPDGKGSRGMDDSAASLYRERENLKDSIAALEQANAAQRMEIEKLKRTALLSGDSAEETCLAVDWTLIKNQGAAGGADEDTVGDVGQDTGCETGAGGTAACGMARRRPSVLVRDEDLPVLKQALLRDACRSIRSMFQRLHHAQMVWDGLQRPAYFPVWTRAAETELQSAESIRRNIILEAVLPIIEGECGRGFTLQRLGGDICGLSFCDGIKYLCVSVPSSAEECTQHAQHMSHEKAAGAGAEPQAHEHACVIYSFGSNKETSFEQELVSVWPNCHIHIFDCHSYPPGLTFSSENPHISEHGWCLDRIDSPEHGRYTFNTIVTLLGHQHTDIALLKMDIEGWEWFFFEELAARVAKDTERHTFSQKVLSVCLRTVDILRH